jgi:hypothetical protein
MGLHPVAGRPIFQQFLAGIQETVQPNQALVEEVAGQLSSSVSQGLRINAPPYPAIKDGWYGGRLRVARMRFAMMLRCSGVWTKSSGLVSIVSTGVPS